MIFKYIMRWEFVDNTPKELDSFVMIGAPHTSNWDFVPAMAISYYSGRKCHFIIKKEWIRFPLKNFFKSVGGIGVDRNLIKQGVVSSTTDLLANLFQDKNFVLMIAPEGTRSPNSNWKTGFYYIAQKANVPLVLGFGDYKKKIAGLGKVIYPTDFDADIKVIKEFYTGLTGKTPENYLVID